MSVLQLDTLTHLQPDGCHRFEFVLTNLGANSLTGFSLGFASQPLARVQIQGKAARQVRLEAEHHEYAPPGGLSLAPGDSWRVAEADIGCEVALLGDTGWTVALIPQDGPALALLASDLQIAGHARVMRGGGDMVGVLPQPASARIASFAAHAPLHLLIQGDLPGARALAVHVNALSHRLFPARPTPFVFAAVAGTPVLQLRRDASLASAGYRLVFKAGDAVLSFASPEGLHHGLVTLAQMLGAAWQDPARFALPADGVIEDQPRHDWRGMHLDMPRRMHGPQQILRILDIMAWLKMNRLHWQLADGEDWMIEVGSPRRLRPAIDDGACRYTRTDAQEVVAHARSLGIEVMPEIDLPGFYAQALGGSAPGPVAQNSLISGPSLVRGYPDTALDSAQDQAWDMTVRILDEICDIFPFEVIHIGGAGGDEGSWLNSPRAEALRGSRQLADTADLRAGYLRHAHSLLRAYYLRRVHALLQSRGRITGAWAELAQGRTIPPGDSLLFLRDAGGGGLVALDYDVIGRVEPGPSCRSTAPAHLKGIEMCQQSSPFAAPSAPRHQAIRQLLTVAEAGWTADGAIDPRRLPALAELVPRI